MMPDREKVIRGLEICRHRVISQENCKQCPYIYDGRAKQSNCEGVLHWDAIALLKKLEERKGNYVPCKVKTPTGKWNGEKCSVCGTEYIGSAPLQWKFCPDCGAKMEGR